MPTAEQGGCNLVINIQQWLVTLQISTEGNWWYLSEGIQHHVTVNISDIVPQAGVVVGKEMDRVHRLDLRQLGVKGPRLGARHIAHHVGTFRLPGHQPEGTNLGKYKVQSPLTDMLTSSSRTSQFSDVTSLILWIFVTSNYVLWLLSIDSITEVVSLHCLVSLLLRLVETGGCHRWILIYQQQQLSPQLNKTRVKC